MWKAVNISNVKEIIYTVLVARAFGKKNALLTTLLCKCPADKFTKNKWFDEKMLALEYIHSYLDECTTPVSIIRVNPQIMQLLC